MKILFDQGTPVPLRRILVGHVVATAFEKGWSTLSNGNLLREAEMQFDLLITTDKNLEYQQNLTGRSIAFSFCQQRTGRKSNRIKPKLSPPCIK